MIWGFIVKMVTWLLVCQKQRHESLLQLCISSLSACQKYSCSFAGFFKILLLNTLFVGDFRSDFSFIRLPLPLSPSTPKAGWGSSPVYLYFLSPPIPPPLPDHLGRPRDEQFFELTQGALLHTPGEFGVGRFSRKSGNEIKTSFAWMSVGQSVSHSPRLWDRDKVLFCESFTSRCSPPPFTEGFNVTPAARLLPVQVSDSAESELPEWGYVSTLSPFSIPLRD